jgi:hypothetical protein
MQLFDMYGTAGGTPIGDPRHKRHHLLYELHQMNIRLGIAGDGLDVIPECKAYKELWDAYTARCVLGCCVLGCWGAVYWGAGVLCTGVAVD